MIGSPPSSPQPSTPPRTNFRTVLYAACGLLLGAGLTLGGYLVDYIQLYGSPPATWNLGILKGLHAVTPVHYFADLFAVVLGGAGAILGMFHDRLLFYSRKLEERVRERTRELQRSEESYALAVQGSNDGIWDWEIPAGKVNYSERWKAMLGLQQSDPSPDAWLERVHPEDRQDVEDRIRTHLEGASSHLEVEYRLRHADGTYRWMLARGIALRDKEGEPYRMAGSQTDIHDRRLGEEELRRLALHDRLTGLPNRSLLLDRLGRAIHRCRATRTNLAVLHVGVDRFKKINESLGPEAADEVLVEVGRRLTRVLEIEDEMQASSGAEEGLPPAVHRIEGDEFVIVLEQVRSLREATWLAERILRVHEAPLKLDGREVLVRVSIGITLGPRGYAGGAELIRDAQTAMHRAKNKGRGQVETFDREMHQVVEEDLQLQTELFQALDKGELQLWYQPVFEIASRRIAGFEALARWNHPVRGMIPTGRFINLAEETGQIVELSRWLIDSAFKRAARWQAGGGDLRDLCLNMNLSPKNIFHPDLERDLDEVLARTGVDPSRIHLEVTETCFIDNPMAAAGALGRLKRRGFRIALDDFGTGYSSLSLLHELPFDILKIDRTFVAKLGDAPDVDQIVRTIVGLGEALAMDVVAEGIETEEHLSLLRAMQCRYGQGYLLGEPMPAEEAEALVSTASPSQQRETVGA